MARKVPMLATILDYFDGVPYKEAQEILSVVRHRLKARAPVAQPKVRRVITRRKVEPSGKLHHPASDTFGNAAMAPKEVAEA